MFVVKMASGRQLSEKKEGFSGKNYVFSMKKQ